MMKAFRILYAVVALLLFLSIVLVGVMLLFHSDLANMYLRRVLFAIVGGAVVLPVFDLIGRRIER